AKSKKAAAALSQQFANRIIEKRYNALVSVQRASPDTVPEWNAGTEWNDWMRKLPDAAAAEIVPRQHADAKHAMLTLQQIQAGHWTRENGFGPPSADGIPVLRLSIVLGTGRTHQIRLQCASRGMPILGDQQYGSPFEFDFAALASGNSDCDDGIESETPAPDHETTHNHPSQTLTEAPGDVPLQTIERNRRRKIALHASEICFRHPKTARMITVSSRSDFDRV
ncbi:MAG: pseudouridine synthase, partial [Planctomycetota bacterium]